MVFVTPSFPHSFRASLLTRNKMGVDPHSSGRTSGDSKTLHEELLHFFWFLSAPLIPEQVSLIPEAEPGSFVWASSFVGSSSNVSGK